VNYQKRKQVGKIKEEKIIGQGKEWKKVRENQRK